MKYDFWSLYNMTIWFCTFKKCKFYVGTNRLHLVQIFVADTFPNFFLHVFHQNLNKKNPLLSYKSYWKYLLSSKIPKCNATQIFLAFFPRRKKKKYGMCFCTWHFLQFSSHLAQSGVGCLWPPPSTSTFTDNYTTTQAKGHTKLLRILIQYTYMSSLEYGQYCSY